MASKGSGDSSEELAGENRGRQSVCVLCVCVDTGQRRSLQTRLGGEEEPETFVPGIEISSRD